jgi:hypothetical protein
MSPSIKRSFVLLIAIAMVAALLSACGPSATDYANTAAAATAIAETYYANTAIAASDTYSKSFQTAMDTISSAKTADDMKSQDYKDKVATALSAWDAAGKVLGGSPDSQVPSKAKDFNAMLVQISAQTSTSVAEVNAALAADDPNQLLTAIQNMQKITDLLNQAAAKAPSAP